MHVPTVLCNPLLKGRERAFLIFGIYEVDQTISDLRNSNHVTPF